MHALHLSARITAIGVLLATIAALLGSPMGASHHGKGASVQAMTIRVIPKRRVRYTIKLTALERQAMRLNKRIEAQTGAPMNTLSLVRALDERKRMARGTMTVTFVPDVSKTFEEKYLQPWTLSLHGNGWVSFQPDAEHPHFAVDETAIANILATNPPPESYPPQHTGVIAPVQDGDVIRVRSGMFAHAGFTVEPVQAARMLSDAIATGQSTVYLPVTYMTPKAYIIDGNTVQELSLLGSGRSDFGGSPLGRSANITRALQERITNILVPPEGTFSFNEALGRIDQEKGWHEALGIFNGNELRMVRGGGICQAATTVYRAALLAGFPILERRNHSIYVSYYKKYGLGIDATVYPGEQDLAFQNDTDHDLFLQSRIEGTEAVVNIYGVPDGRKVSVTGPYLSATAPEDLLVDGKRKLASNEIGWLRTVKRGGIVQHDVVVSTYKGFPKSLAKEPPHAAAYALE